jgi:hypothetical protein
LQRPGSTGFEEAFQSNVRGWPDDAESTAALAAGGYRLVPRDAGRFVAVRAPGSDRFNDVRVTGTFRKLGGPDGGGYGLILRDQSPAPLDGIVQTGSYYLFEVGDRGEVGIWRRDGDRWIDILPWTAAAAVHPKLGSNELVVQAVGAQIDFFVNGTRVAGTQDTSLTGDGSVGVFAGGDGNDVLLARFSVAPLR